MPTESLMLQSEECTPPWPPSVYPYIDGTDETYQYVRAYRIGVRNKKRWRPFFALCLDVTMNSCTLHNNKLSNKKFPIDLLLWNSEHVQKYGKDRDGSGQDLYSHRIIASYNIIASII